MDYKKRTMTGYVLVTAAALAAAAAFGGAAALTDEDAFEIVEDRYEGFIEAFMAQDFAEIASEYYCRDVTFMAPFGPAFFEPNAAIPGILAILYDVVQTTAPGASFLLQPVETHVKADGETFEEIGAALIEGVPGEESPFAGYYYGLWKYDCDGDGKWKLLTDILSVGTGPEYVDPRAEAAPGPDPE